MNSPDTSVRDGVARDIVFLETVGINPVVVHGGGKAISQAMKKAGLPSEFVQGMRITDNESALLVEQVLSKEINPQIVQTINRLGGEAMGFSGTEIFTCRKHYVHTAEKGKIDVGFVGDVVHVNTAPLLDCIDRNITPVISPTARGEDGEIYNCNADVSAAKCAISLDAKRLVFMSDVPGLLRNPDDLNSLIPHVQTDEVDRLKNDGIVGKGMIPKIDSAVEAVKSGVAKVSLVDGRVPHAVMLEIFTDEGVGTELVY